MKKNQIPILLAIIIFIAFIVRFEAAKRYNVIVDESILVLDSHRSFSDLFFLNYWNTAHPPLYDIINKITVIAQGTTPFDIRIKSQIFGALSLFFLFKIVFLLTKSINTSFVAVILIIFSGFHVGLSAFNRPYGFQQFFILGFLFYFLKIFLNQPQKKEKNLIFLFVFSVLATLTDYSFLWVLASIYIIVIIDFVQILIKKQLKKETILNYLKILFISIIPFLFWLPIFLSKVNSAVSLENYLKNSMSSTPAIKLIGMTIQNMFFIVKDDNFYVFTFTFIIIFTIFIGYKYLKSHDPTTQKSYLFLVIVATIPFVTSLIVSYLFSPVFLSRNLFVCSYPYIIFLSLVISRLTSFNKIYQTFLISTIIIFQYLTMHTTIRNNSNFDYSNEVAQARGIIFEEKLLKYEFVFDNSLPQASSFVWGYYLNMLDHKNIDGIKIVNVPKPKDDPEFILLAYSDPPKIPKNVINPYNCINLNINLPKDIRLFKCTIKEN